RYAIRVYPDRWTEYLYGAEGGMAKLDPRGYLLGSGSRSMLLRFEQGRFQPANDQDSETVAIDAHTAPNGVPVGFYRGAAHQSPSIRAHAAVVPDGRIWWAAFTHGAEWQHELMLSGGALHGEGHIPEHPTPSPYRLTATPDGTLHLTQLPASLPPLTLHWS